MLPVEKATSRADLPHAFAGTEQLCTTCQRHQQAEVHRSWLAWREAAAAADRAPFPREFGA